MKKLLVVTILFLLIFAVFSFSVTPRKINFNESKKNGLLQTSSLLLDSLNLSETCANGVEVDFVKTTKQIDVTGSLIDDIVFSEKSSFGKSSNSEISAFWARSFGGAERDVFNYIQETADNGYIAAGLTKSFGARGIDVLVVKFYSTWDIEWAKMFVGEDNTDWAYSVQQTKDGGYIVSGVTWSFGAIKDDVLLIKLDSKGNIEWAKKYASIRADASWLCLQTKDNGYILVGDVYRGTTNFPSDILVMKLDIQGNVEWAKAFGTDIERSVASSIQETADGGYIIGGVLGEKSDAAVIIKLNATGNVEWSREIDGIESDGGCSIQQTEDKGYILSGWTMSFGAGNNDVLVVKLEENGNLSWAKAYGESKDDWSNFIYETKDKGFIVAGGTTSFGLGDQDMLMLKINKEGNIEWAKIFGGKLNERIWSAVQTTKGSYVAAGESNSFGAGNFDTIILYLDERGNIPGASCEYLKDVTSELKVRNIDSGFIIPSVIETNLKYTVTLVTFTPVTLNTQIEDICKSLIYRIDALSDNNGVITPQGPVEVYFSSSQTFTITPNTGYKIKDVKVDGASVGAVSTYIFENVMQDHTIEAIFEPITFTINASAGSGGAISPSGTVTINYGGSKTFTMSPSSGYRVANVIVDGVSKGSISSYTFSNITSDHTISATFEKEITQTIIILQIGNTTFTVNGSTRTLDSPPIIKNSRTLLPIRAVVEALGGSVGWDASTKKVTVSLGSTTIELWIGKSIAKVNGIDTPIDPANPNVVPEIINSRTMLPLRFVTENLGCDVHWDGTTKTITITYGG